MSSRIAATVGVIDNLDTKEIRVFKDDTTMKWSGRLKNKSIILLDTSTVALLSLFKSGDNSILGAAAYVIGVDSQAWSYSVKTGNTIQVGMAEESRDLSTLVPNKDHVSVQLNVVAGDQIIFLLELDELRIEHIGNIYTINLLPFTGKTMRAWLSGIIGKSGFSVAISQYRSINFSINVNNIASITTGITKEISTPLSFDAGNQPITIGNANFDAAGATTQPGGAFSIISTTTGMGLTVSDADGSVTVDNYLKTDIIQHITSGPLQLKGSGVAPGMELDVFGNLSTSGDLVTACIKASPGGSIAITNNANIGITVNSAGAVTFDNSLKLNAVQPNTSTNLSLVEGTNNLGMVVADTTGIVTVTGSGLTCSVIDSSATPLTIGGVTQAHINMGGIGKIVEIKDNADILEGVSVIGNIILSGTVDGIDIAASTAGLVTVHSDVTSAGSGAIITSAERAQISTNAANTLGTVTAHSDITNAGSGAIITGVERTAIDTNTTNNTGVVTAHSDITDAGSGAIISGAERTAIGTNNTNNTGSVNIHSDMAITMPVNLDIISYNGGSWTNRSLTAAGVASSSHTHTVSGITNASAAFDGRIALQKAALNGIATLDTGGTVPSSQLDIDGFNFAGSWNADTNDPTLTSSVGVSGATYTVGVSGSTDLNGITDWKVNDWCVFTGGVWEKVDNTDLVLSVAGKTGVVTLSTADISDITSVGSGAIISGVERTAIGTNTTNNTGVVTVHSDVTDAGSGAIITGGERTAIGTNTTNNNGVVTVHSDVTDAGSGAIITGAERTAILNGATGSIVGHFDISNAGSGAIITGAERTAIGTNTTNNTGSVTVHSDVTSVGSGAIISGAERTAIGTNTTNTTGVVTVHSDVTDAGSSVIISVAERAAIGVNNTAINGLLNLSGGTLTGNIDMNDNNILNATNTTIKGVVTLGVTEGAPAAINAILIGSKTTFTSVVSATQWIAPANTEHIVIKLWGAGGSGGQYNNAAQGQSTGGGGGYTELTYAATAGDEFWTTVGKGGIHAGAGGNVGDHGEGGDGTNGSTTYKTGGAGSYSSIHKLSGGNYTLIACAGGGGGGGTGGSAGIGGDGGGGNGVTGGAGDSGGAAGGTGGSAGTGGAGGGTQPNGENYSALTETSLAAFGGAGATSGDGGAGGGGYGGGGAGQYSGGGGGGGEYVDGTGTSPSTVTGTTAVANSADTDYVAGKGNGAFSSGTGQPGVIVLGAYYTTTDWHARKIKAVAGNDVVLENFSGSASVTVNDAGGIDMSGVVTLENTTDAVDLSTGSLVIAGGMAIAKNLTVGDVARLEHQASAPPAPATNNGYFYVRNSLLYFMGDNGTEQTVTIV